jgi:EcoEI R protein C-terminal/HsdM N-terminal domain
VSAGEAKTIMFEQAFKNIDDVLWKEAGCSSELDYTEQASWLLFLKYLDDLEQDKSTEAALDGKKYTHILDKSYRWESWAAPKDKDGKLDHNKALTGDDLRDFVNGKLFPYLHSFKLKASSSNTIEYKIGEIFGEIKNKIQSGYNLREIIDQIDELHFRSQTEKHELSHLYEAKIKNMGTPMSAQQFMEMLFGKLPEFFKDEAELRALWSAPDTRKQLLNGLADRGFGHEQLAEMQKIIDAEKSDLFDVLAFVAYALPTLTREERADRAKVAISARFNGKQQAFLNFVLAHYVGAGVDELDQEKLTPLLRLKYLNSISDAIADLGRPEEISAVFVGFQKYLYESVA